MASANEIALEEIRTVQNKVLQIILPYTVPVISMREIGGQLPALAGSGILLQIDEERFLVTAAHTIAASAVATDRRPILLPSGVATEPMVALTGGRMFFSPAAQDDPYHLRDKVDVGVLHLLPRDAVNIGGYYKYLRLGQVDLNDPFTSNAYYAVVGYPNQEFTINKEKSLLGAPPLNWGCRRYMGKRGKLPDFNPEIHAALNFTKGIHHISKEVKEPPDPHGMSGCGVWRILENAIAPQNYVSAVE